MKTRFLFTLLLLFGGRPVVAGPGPRLLLVVRDLEERPVAGLRFSYGGVFSSSTSRGGAAEIALPMRHLPGQSIKILLVSRTSPREDWFLINPLVNIPQDPYFAELVVMRRSAVRRMAAERLESRQRLNGEGSRLGDEVSPSLVELAGRYHLKPEQVEPAIRAFAASKNARDQGIAAYLASEYSKAEKLLREVVGAGEKNLVEDLRLLSDSLGFQGKFAEAEIELRKALALQPENIDVLRELGWTLEFQEKWAQAELVMRKVLALAEDQPDPLRDLRVWALYNLASTYEKTGRLSEAASVLRTIVELREECYGPSDRRTARALGSLSGFLWQHDCPAEALALTRRILALDVAAYGDKDQRTRADLDLLALLLEELNRPKEALEAVELSLAAHVERLGADHPKTLLVRDAKARLLFQVNRLDEAERITRENLSIGESLQGLERHLLPASLHALASLLEATNRPDEAEPLVRRSLAYHRLHYGFGPLVIGQDLDRLAAILLALGCLDQAEEAEHSALTLFVEAGQTKEWPLPSMAEPLERYERILRNFGRAKDEVRVRVSDFRRALPLQTAGRLCSFPPPL